MNVKKLKNKSVRKSPHGKSVIRKRVPLAKQVSQLRRELREVKAQRDCFAKEIARLMRPEIDEILRKDGDLLKYADDRPTVVELLEELSNGAES
jgi:hypothetical protein